MNPEYEKPGFHRCSKCHRERAVSFKEIRIETAITVMRNRATDFAEKCAGGITASEYKTLVGAYIEAREELQAAQKLPDDWFPCHPSERARNETC